MYSPTLGRWIQNDPIGFEAGDPNLYRMEGNNPTNRLDPSGLIESEGEALGILTTEIARWRNNGWNFAANLLQHFINNTGGKPYIPSEADINQVKQDSRSVVYQAIAAAKKSPITSPKGPCKEGATFQYKGHVRWKPEGVSESQFGALHGTFLSDELIVGENNHLFYAYGGADLKVDIKVTKCRCVKNPRNGVATNAFDVEAKVTISDTYTFDPRGPFGLRLLADAYAAAHYLEKSSGYKSFEHTLTFTDAYSGFVW